MPIKPFAIATAVRRRASNQCRSPRRVSSVGLRGLAGGDGQQTLDHRHHGARLRAVAGGVADGGGQGAGRRWEEVVVVAANLGRGFHEDRDLQTRVAGQGPRQ